MSGPRRWLETEETSVEALELLRAGRPPLGMNDAVRKRSRRRVAGLSMLPAAAGAFVSWPQLALGALLGTVGSMAVISLPNAVTPHSASASSSSVAHPIDARPAPNRAPVPTPAPDNTQSPTTFDTVPVLAASGSARHLAPGGKPDASESPRTTLPAEGLQQEIQLLEQARSKLTSAPAQARQLLLEHEQRFAGGQLRIEREFLLIDALVRLGRRDEAEARARVLESQASKSLYGERLNQILGAGYEQK